MVEPDSLLTVLETGKPSVGTLLAGQGDPLAFPVRWPVLEAGRPRPVITAAAEPDQILAVVRKQQVPNDWIVSVFDGAGRRVARSRNQAGTLGGNGSPTAIA